MNPLVMGMSIPRSLRTALNRFYRILERHGGNYLYYVNKKTKDGYLRIRQRGGGCTVDIGVVCRDVQCDNCYNGGIRLFRSIAYRTEHYSDEFHNNVHAETYQVRY